MLTIFYCTLSPTGTLFHSSNQQQDKNSSWKNGGCFPNYSACKPPSYAGLFKVLFLCLIVVAPLGLVSDSKLWQCRQCQTCDIRRMSKYDCGNEKKKQDTVKGMHALHFDSSQCNTLKTWLYVIWKGEAILTPWQRHVYSPSVLHHPLHIISMAASKLGKNIGGSCPLLPSNSTRDRQNCIESHRINEWFTSARTHLDCCWLQRMIERCLHVSWQWGLYNK